jgi:hypothetical protein
MTKSFPYLALDSAGRRTILCDHPVPMFGDNTTKKETTKMTLSADQLTRYVGMRIRNPAAANRYWARCMGRDIAADAAMDDETTEKLKGFLRSRLSAEDHEQVCNMLAGDVEAEDTEPPPNDPDAEPQGKLASDAARADFYKQFPDAAKIGIDNSGIPHRGRATSGRAASYSADGAASFAAMFPDAARIKVL